VHFLCFKAAGYLNEFRKREQPNRRYPQATSSSKTLASDSRWSEISLRKIYPQRTGPNDQSTTPTS